MDEIVETTKVNKLKSLKPYAVSAAKFTLSLAAAAAMTALMDKAMTGVARKFNKPNVEG